MKVRYTKIVLALVVIIGSVLFYKSSYSTAPKAHLQAFLTGKPVLKVGVMNFEKSDTNNPYTLWGMLSEKYTIQKVDSTTSDNYDVLVTGWFEDRKVPESKNPNLIKIHYTAETYVGDPKARTKDHDLVLGFDFIDAPNYIRLPFAYIFYNDESQNDKMRHDYQRKEQKCEPQKKKHFACFLASNGGYEVYHFNGAHLRNRLFHLLSLYKPVMSGGRWLNNTRGPIPRGTELEWLSQCKFTIAYENDISYPGYITEKPFQAWFAGTVPLYNSHPDSLVDINKNAVIYAGDFKTEEELVEYIKKVDNDDELYCKIWNERLLTDPEKDYSVVRAKVTKKLDEILAKKFGK
ncbi:MAG: glycosyltransferase family 10 [Pseudomonadota bacterium]